MGQQRPEGKRRAPDEGQGHAPAGPAEMARLWGAASSAYNVLAKRRLYWLATETEERLGEHLPVIPLLQDWIPATSDEAAELTSALRRYVGDDLDAVRDREARALSTCIRGMTLFRARSSVPFPTDDGESIASALIS